MKKTSIMLLFFLCFVVTIFPRINYVKTQTTTIVVPDDFSKIQEAVDNANHGDTIFIKSGTYHNQTVIIDKSLFLIGEKKTNTRIIGDWSLNGTVVLVLHDSVTIQNLTLASVHGSGSSGRGIHLLHVNYCVVSDCNFVGNGIGVWLYGASENIIKNNNMEKMRSIPHNAGIKLQNSQYNSIIRNNLSDNNLGYGIILDTSFGNNLTQNRIIDNYWGLLLKSSTNNRIMENIFMLTRDIFVADTNQAMRGSYGIGFQFSSGNILTGNTFLGTSIGIRMVSSSCYNIIENNSISNSIYYGLQLVDNTNNNLISVNIVNANRYGLRVKSSSNNTITINNITDNLIGIVFENSSNNIIYHNNFIKNNNHVEIKKGIDVGESVNVFEKNKEGNYWDNYYGADYNENGIGDLPYPIDENNQDNYPLIEAIIIPEFPSWIILSLFIVTVLVIALTRKRIRIVKK